MSSEHTEIVEVRTMPAHELRPGHVLWVAGPGWCEFLHEDQQSRDDIFDFTARPLAEFEKRTLSDTDETIGERHMRDDLVLVRRPAPSPVEGERDEWPESADPMRDADVIASALYDYGGTTRDAVEYDALSREEQDEWRTVAIGLLQEIGLHRQFDRDLAAQIARPEGGEA